jgi:hypothetical protein
LPISAARVAICASGFAFIASASPRRIGEAFLVGDRPPGIGDRRLILALEPLMPILQLPFEQSSNGENRPEADLACGAKIKTFETAILGRKSKVFERRRTLGPAVVNGAA